MLKAVRGASDILMFLENPVYAPITLKKKRSEVDMGLMSGIRKRTALVMFICAGLLSLPPIAFGGQKEIELKLGGQYCGVYLDDVKHALRKLHGVGKISFNSSQDRVTIAEGSDGPKQAELIDAINSVKGDGWYCQAESLH